MQLHDGPEIVILSEVSQTQKDKDHMTSLICGVWANGSNEFIYKTNRVTDVKKQTYDYQEGMEVCDKLVLW